MDIAISSLAIGVGLVTVPVVLGVVVGAWMTRGKMLAERQRRLEAERAQQVIAGVLQWANSVKGDVSQYSLQMASLSRQLHETEHPPENEADGTASPVADTDSLLTQMEESNEQLQHRLHAAEAALAEQSGQIESYLSQARTDPLTGLPNRRAFDEELARRFAEFSRKGAPLSIVLFDIDKFKSFNDEFGHMTGDEVLVAVAERLRDQVRDIDTVARFGGEEFALILPDTRAKAALLPAERARLAVATDTAEYDGREVQVTVSCGVAETQPGEELDSVLRRADEALYASKDAGRNCTHLHDGSRLERIDVENLLPIGPPRQRTAPEPTGLIPTRFTGVCRDLREKMLEHLRQS